MCDNSKCKTAIETEWISTDYGQQLKFAVPESGMNEPSVDVVEEIKKDISIYFSEILKTCGTDYEKSIIREIYDGVLEIFYEYRK